MIHCANEGTFESKRRCPHNDIRTNGSNLDCPWETGACEHPIQRARGFGEWENALLAGALCKELLSGDWKGAPRRPAKGVNFLYVLKLMDFPTILGSFSACVITKGAILRRANTDQWMVSFAHKKDTSSRQPYSREYWVIRKWPPEKGPRLTFVGQRYLEPTHSGWWDV